jgi:hypothetical protein
MRINHTGFRPWQLTGPTGQSVTWRAGGNGRFQFGDVPELTDGKLCNHFLGVLLTILIPVGVNGVFTAGADADDFLTALFESVEVRNCWHGTPISQNHAKGCMLGTMEFMACGYQYFGRRMDVVARGALGSKFLKVNAFLPLSYLMGDKAHHTALPVTFYKNGELQLNFGAGLDSGGDGLSATFTTATIQASAVLLPESEIHLGPGSQFIDYPSAANAGSEVVKMDSFGNNTTLQDVESGAACDFLFWLSSLYNQGQGFVGPARVKDLTRVGFPFRGVQSTTHLEPFLLGFEAQVGGREDGQSDLYDATAMQVVKSNLSGFPYRPNYAGPLTADFAADGSDVRDMKGFPIIYPGNALELTKVQSFEGTQSYFLTFASGKAPLSGTTHHSFAHHFYSWTPAKWEDAMRTLVNAGIAQAVLGTSQGIVWSTKLTKKNGAPGLIDPAKLRYLPNKLALGVKV